MKTFINYFAVELKMAKIVEGKPPQAGDTSDLGEDNNQGDEKKKIIILKQYYPVEQEFTVSNGTIFGRSNELGWFVDRERPQILDTLDTLVTVVNDGGEEDRQVSRIHVGFYSEIVDGEEQFFVEDLNSYNGTFLKRAKKRKPIRVSKEVLSKEDRINIANVLSLHVDHIGSADKYHQALLVGWDPNDGTKNKDNLDSLVQQLNKRGFKDNVKVLNNSNASKENIFDRFSQLDYTSSSTSHFIFYFAGEENDQGLCLANGETISPFELYKGLKNIRGRKAVILDVGKRESAFMKPENLSFVPHNTLVLISRNENNPSDTQQYFSGNNGYQLTEALTEYLRDNKEEFNLREIRQHLHSVGLGKDTFDSFYQEPYVSGACFTIISAQSQSFIPDQ